MANIREVAGGTAKFIFLSDPLRPWAEKPKGISAADAAKIYRDNLDHASLYDLVAMFKDIAIGSGLLLVPFPPVQFMSVILFSKAVAHSVRGLSELAAEATSEIRSYIRDKRP